MTLRPLVLACAIPTAAAAEFDRVSVDLCNQIFETVTVDNALPLTVGAISTGPAGCVFRDIAFEGQNVGDFSIHINRLTIAAAGIDAFIADQTPLRAVKIDMDGLRYFPVIGDATFEYLYRVQNQRMSVDANLDVSWDAARQVISLTQFEVVFDPLNSVSATYEIANADLSSLGALETSLGGMAITHMTLDLQSNGLFESLVLPVLVTTLIGYDEDPEAEVEALKTMATRAILGFPSEIFPGETRHHLATVVDDMPNPAGTLSLEISSDVGIGATRLMPAIAFGAPRSLEEVWPLLDGVKIEAEYVRQEGAE